jgi:hypothetical protein
MTPEAISAAYFINPPISNRKTATSKTAEVNNLHISFMLEQIIMKFGLYIMSSGTISTA